MTAIEEFSDNKNICHCPIDEIEYLIGVDNINAVNVKTGKCLRCFGIRLNKLGIILKGKRIYHEKKDYNQKLKGGTK